MGANIKHLKLHQTKHEDETGRVSCNYVKGTEFHSSSFNSGDYGIYYCGGFVPTHLHDPVASYNVKRFLNGISMMPLRKRFTL